MILKLFPKKIQNSSLQNTPYSNVNDDSNVRTQMYKIKSIPILKQ